MDFFSDGESFFGKAKLMVSYVRGMVLWVSMLKSPMQNRKVPTTTHQTSLQHVGLKILIYTPPNPRYTNADILHSYMKLMISTLSPPPLPPASINPSPSIVLRTLTSSSSEYDDVIGAESGVNYMNSKEEEMFGLMQENHESNSHSHHLNTDHGKRNHRSHCEKKRELPPPMTPWVLTRYYCDGRLVIKDETFVNHRPGRHKNFEAVRENGHLTLNLIPLEKRIREEHLEERENDHNHYVLHHESILSSSYSSCSMPNESFLWGGIERCDQDLRKCFTYSDAIMAQQYENRNILTTVV